ncbi:MAG: PSD1 and planctomycete cytochrome C domain-containing protein [Planctomycetota bacterium]
MPLVSLMLLAIAGNNPGGEAFFESRIRPVLVEHCQKCHGPAKQQASLRLDSSAALAKGGDTGPVVVPGNPDASLLIKVIRYTGESQMPPKGKLPAMAIADLEQWVRDGAKWPAGEKAVSLGGPPDALEARKTHWAFRPVADPVPPVVRNTGWVRDPIDAFVLAGIEAAGLRPAPEANRGAYIRRVTYDLTGLPPTPGEIDAFLSDKAPGAHERLVDRLLASPRFGERWARHWMDISRYADTKGYVFQEDRRYPFAWTYRDWLVNSINADMPYDRFVALQVAADVWPDKEKKDLAALGFLTLGRRFLNNVHDIIDDRLDVTFRGLMGITIGCARCHDHKFDPVPIGDYYSLHGVFLGSSEPKDLPALSDAPGSESYQKALAGQKKELDDLLRKYGAEIPAKLRSQAGAYMLSVRDAGLPPSERVLPPAQDAALRRPVLDRWRRHLEQRDKERDNVFAAWRALSPLKASEWKAKGSGLVAELGKRAAEQKWPGALADLVKDLPENHGALATRYQTLFDKAMESPGDAALAPVRASVVGKDAPCDVPPGEIERYLDRAERNRVQEARKKLDAFVARNAGEMPRAMALAETGPQQARVLLRGNPGNPGPTVPRQFLLVAAGAERKAFSKGTGRLELAEAIVSKTNPLTPRVAVNRLWMLHFGQGLSRTPGDFGLRGEAPTHPGLLDHLATRLMRDHWSMKKLHRAMVLSATYRQVAGHPVAEEQDPDNRLWARANRRKLEFEALRDGMLAVSGKLDPAMGGPSVEILTAPYSGRRGVYGFIDRQNLPGTFRAFDLASPDLATPTRHATTVPQQALYLLNNPFALEMGRALAARPELEGLSPAARVVRLYRLALGREPDDAERDDAVAHASSRPGGLAEVAHALLCCNEFQFID